MDRLSLRERWQIERRVARCLAAQKAVDDAIDALGEILEPLLAAAYEEENRDTALEIEALVREVPAWGMDLARRRRAMSNKEEE